MSSHLVLVTGAAQRLGRAIALDLARHGYDIALHYRSSHDAALATAAEIGALGRRCEAFGADLADEAACNALLPRVRERLGAVHAVVNNASAFELDDVATFSHRAMELHWRANTAPAVLLARALGRGVVVNLLDQKLWNPNPDYFSYTLSKAALEAATQMLAMALAPDVRVCGVAPGLTLTSDLISPEHFAKMHRRTILGRASTPEDIARSVRFLIESPGITGTTLLVDGGQHLTRQPRDIPFMN